MENFCTSKHMERKEIPASHTPDEGYYLEYIKNPYNVTKKKAPI